MAVVIEAIGVVIEGIGRGIAAVGKALREFAEELRNEQHRIASGLLSESASDIGGGAGSRFAGELQALIAAIDNLEAVLEKFKGEKHEVLEGHLRAMYRVGRLFYQELVVRMDQCKSTPPHADMIG